MVEGECAEATPPELQDRVLERRGPASALRRAGQEANLVRQAWGPSSPRPSLQSLAMENGRCWHHGGASTGPKTPEGRARLAAALIESMRVWRAERRAAGMKSLGGRKRGERWVTEPMRERARAEAHRLGAGRFTLDRALTLALLRSANGCLESNAKAKAMLDAQERAATERDRQAALARIRELRASLLANR